MPSAVQVYPDEKASKHDEWKPTKEAFIVIFDGSENSDAQLSVALLLLHVEMHVGVGVKWQILGTNGNYRVHNVDQLVCQTVLAVFFFVFFFRE